MDGGRHRPAVSQSSAPGGSDGAVAIPVRACRACGHDHLDPVLSLGSTPVANALVDPGTPTPDPVHPLEVVFCPACSLVQLGWELPADAIFGEDYPYYSSFSGELLAHAAQHVAGLVARRNLDRHSLVVEVASNDGYLLRELVARDVRVLGVDPSPGPAAAAEAVGVPTMVAFFGREVASVIRREHGPADVIIANNVMAHVPDLDDFVGGLAMLLADDGVLTVENPWVRELVERLEFDTIYHEHYCYFSSLAVDALMHRHDLHLNDIEHFPNLHGGTLRWTIGRRPDRTSRCEQILADELSDGLGGIAYYSRLAERVLRCQQELLDLLHRSAAEGARIAAYGATAKGATMLNSTGIGTDIVEYVVDKNPHKQGRLMPGARLPIRPVEALLEDQPDLVVLLAWNFADEIAREQREYLERGGRFLVPIPRPHLLDVDD